MIMIDPYVLGVFVVAGILAIGLTRLISRRRNELVREEAVKNKLRERGEVQAQYALATEKAMQDLKASVEGLATCMANLELRMRTVDQRQRKLDEQSAQLMRRRGFDEAVALVRDGNSTHDIAHRCGLPLAEVELLKRIQQKTLEH